MRDSLSCRSVAGDQAPPPATSKRLSWRRVSTQIFLDAPRRPSTFSNHNSQSTMESSRIFVRGLPPSLSEDEIRKHFSRRGTTTDVKIFPSRRIGYVGY